jgi:hypothetical protein
MSNVWRWIKSHWQAVAGAVSLFLVALYALLSRINTRQAEEYKRQAHEAGVGKVERVADATEANKKAQKHGEKANRHQERAEKAVERMEAKGGPMAMDEARELARRIAGEE